MLAHAQGWLKGFWSKGKQGRGLWDGDCGFSHQHWAIGIKEACTETWTTRYVKDAGMVLSEELERNRREPVNK